MEIIMNYIESLFAGVPVNEQTRRLREDITANMSDKYDELIKDGKSTNEAIGTVISEFGNIDEVLTEMGIDRAASPVVQTEDPAAIHKNRIRLFGALAGVGTGALTLGASFVSGLAIRGYGATGIEYFGLIFVLTGVMMLIISLLVRTKILVNAGSISETLLPFLRASRDKSLFRHFRMQMIFGGIQIGSFLIFAISDMWNNYSFNGTIFMVIAVSCAFGASVHVLLTERIYMRILGEELPRPGVSSIIGFVSVPFFAFAVIFSKFETRFSGGDEAACIMWALAVLYMVAHVIGVMFDATRKNYERQSAAAVPSSK